MPPRIASSFTVTQLIGAEVKRRRTLLGWRQRDLADAAGISRAMVGTIEQGFKGPGLGVLYDLARAFSCEPSDLIPTVAQAQRRQLEMFDKRSRR